MRLEIAALAALLLLFVAAPTPGDVGGCGQEAQFLDAPTFFATKRGIDCSRCTECAIITVSCNRACDHHAETPKAFPAHCYPLVHDGEVCLRALENASCGEYEQYMDDKNPGSPTECNFCPPR